MLAVWILVTCVALSSATQPSADCVTANTTFYNDASCVNALSQLTQGHGSPIQTQMICDANQQCNTLIGNVRNNCAGYVPESPVSFAAISVCLFIYFVAIFIH